MARSKNSGMKKGFKYNKRKFWYNNLKTETQIFEGDPIPEGFIRGRLKTNKPAWNTGLTKDTDDRLKNMSESLSKPRKKRKYTDEFIASLITDDLYNYWWDNGKCKAMKYFGISSNDVWNICCELLNMVETPEHKQHMHDLIYTEEWKQKRSEDSKGINTWSKGRPLSDEHRIHLSEAQRSMLPEIRKLAKLKEYETKRTRGTFNSSDPEEEYYNYLINIYGIDNVKRQYNIDPRYPFLCDFYIPSEDLFIECNFNWTHGNKPFDPNDNECLALLEEWKIKAKESDYYKNAIETWTVRDVEKFKMAKLNNLNYEVLYTWDMPR